MIPLLLFVANTEGGLPSGRGELKWIEIIYYCIVKSHTIDSISMLVWLIDRNSSEKYHIPTPPTWKVVQSFVNQIANLRSFISCETGEENREGQFKNDIHRL